MARMIPDNLRASPAARAKAEAHVADMTGRFTHGGFPPAADLVDEANHVISLVELLGRDNALEVVAGALVLMHFAGYAAGRMAAATAVAAALVMPHASDCAEGTDA